MWDTGLADRIRAKGVRTIEVGGWRTRGSTTYQPLGALHHHTAGSALGTVPSLTICIYGRSDLAGPLCQVLQSRDPVDDIAYVIAAGRANHAGVGYWWGLDSNSELGGLEVEHVGTTTVPERRLETSCRILAALIEAPGSPRSAGYVAEHFEYALPKGRKIDFAHLWPWNPDMIRERVAYWVGRSAGQPAPPTTVPQEDPVYLLYHPANTFWQIGPGKSATQISPDAYDRMKRDADTPHGLPAFALQYADCEAIIGAMQAP